MRERDKLHKKALSLNCHDTMLVYRKYRNIVTKKIRLAKKAYLIDHLAVQPGADQKDIWKSIKFLLGDKRSNSVIPSSLNCTLLNDHFTSIGSQLCNSMSMYDPIWKGPLSL